MSNCMALSRIAGWMSAVVRCSPWQQLPCRHPTEYLATTGMTAHRRFQTLGNVDRRLGGPLLWCTFLLPSGTDARCPRPFVAFPYHHRPLLLLRYTAFVCWLGTTLPIDRQTGPLF
ncbi:hypothetical protein B0T17DRAFT_274728 [Bombardia bombarda]|uniref:Uncharacterized protein n=1 Tax=Bombardia bombarda TaxID=252184 RepID=A0AA39X1L5_9PEZI|nr:hypothetical protein B0T17DRAFT_274728 [Bombardia bombarda]